MALSIAGDMGEYDDIQIGRKWLSVFVPPWLVSIPAVTGESRETEG